MIDAATLKVIGSGGGVGAVASTVLMFSMFTTQAQFFRHTAEARTGNVLNLIGELKQSPDGRLHDTLCNALREELAMICQDAPTHAFCLDRNDILADSGCR